MPQNYDVEQHDPQAEPHENNDVGDCLLVGDSCGGAFGVVGIDIGILLVVTDRIGEIGRTLLVGYLIAGGGIVDGVRGLIDGYFDSGIISACFW